MVKSSLMMPECAGMARGKTLQTVRKTCILHGNSSSMTFCVCPAWDSSSALGGGCWLDWDQPLLSSFFPCLFAGLFLFPSEISAAQLGY